MFSGHICKKNMFIYLFIYYQKEIIIFVNISQFTLFYKALFIVI